MNFIWNQVDEKHVSNMITNKKILRNENENFKNTYEGIAIIKQA